MRIELYFRGDCGESQEVRDFIRRNSLRLRIIYRDLAAEAGARYRLSEMLGEEESPCLAVDGLPLVGSENIIHWLEETFLRRPLPRRSFSNAYSSLTGR